MKKNRFLFLSFLLIIMGIITFTSCEEDINQSISVNLTLPEANFKLDFNSFVCNGDTLAVDSFLINEETSSKGLHIDLVEYYFDDEKIASTTTYPYGCSYPIQNKSIGDHTLKILVKTSGDGYKSMDYTFNFTIHVLEEPLALGINCLFDNKFEGDTLTINNGEILSGHLELNKSNTIDATITKIEYYWDDQLFGATSIEPYNFSFPINNETIGKHIFKYVATTNTIYGNFTTTSKIPIFVKQ